MMRYLFLLLTFAFTAQLEVDGNLKVTGTVDANGNAITNVGEPVLTSDVATANYVNSRTAVKGRIITLKCPWIYYTGVSQDNYQIITCEPPSCPDGWDELAISNEIITTTGTDNLGGVGARWTTAGNSIRYCIEQEDSE